QALEQQLFRVYAAGSGRSFTVPDRFEVVWADEAVQLADVAHLGPAGLDAQHTLRVRDHRHDLLSQVSLVSKDVDGVADRLAHLVDAVRAQDDRRVRVDGQRLWKVLAVATVPGAHDFACQLEVGVLIAPYRHARGVVDRDVGCLQDGI